MRFTGSGFRLGFRGLCLCLLVDAIRGPLLVRFFAIPVHRSTMEEKARAMLHPPICLSCFGASSGIRHPRKWT
jgi:hypothetical protein